MTLSDYNNNRVKLGLNPSTDEKFAVKIIKHNDPDYNPKLLEAEVKTLQKLTTRNVVKIIDFDQNAEYMKKNGASYKCVAITLELMPNGELFQYIADTGRFSEPVSRAFFKVLIESKYI